MNLYLRLLMILLGLLAVPAGLYTVFVLGADYLPLMPATEPRDLAHNWADMLASEGCDDIAAALCEALEGDAA